MKKVRLWIGLLLLAATLPTPVQAQKDTQLRLNTNPLESARSNEPQIAASGESVYVTWTDIRYDRSDIYFNRSLDGGATWLTSDIRLDTDTPGALGSVLPQIAASGYSVYVAWKELGESLSSHIYFNRSMDGGATWLKENLRLDAGPLGEGRSNGPQIAASGDSVYVAWKGSRIRPTPVSGVLVNRSLDRGVTWLSSEIQVDSDLAETVTASAPQITAAGDSVHLTWQGRPRISGVFAKDLYFNRSIDRGTSWLPASVQLNTRGSRQARGVDGTQAMAASGDAIYVAWENVSIGFATIYFNRSLDAGVTWLPFEIWLDTDASARGPSSTPQIAAIGSSVYVTWRESNHNFTIKTIRFNRSIDAGSTWLAADIGLNNALPALPFVQAPQIAASGDSVYVTWYGSRAARVSAFFNRSLDAGTTWLPSDIRLDTDQRRSSDSLTPQIAASGDSVYVTWVDRRITAEDIYFNIPFGAQAYGEGTAGSGGFVPRLHGTDSLNIGKTLTLTVTGGLGGAFGILVMGGHDSKAAIPSVGGGLLLVNPVERVVPIILDGTFGVPGAGTKSIEIPIPEDNAFLGFNVNLQAVFLDVHANGFVTLTNGVEVWIL